MAIEPTLVKSLDVVILGNFNPIIIQPYWLSKRKLIREEEFEKARIHVISSNVVQFELDWCSFLITEDKFQISSSNEAYFDATKDLLISIFNILSETPLRAAGVNYTYNFSLADLNKYTEFGRWLSNLSFWHEIDPDYRLLTLETTKKKEQNGELGSQRVRISPSELPKIPYGIAVNFNEHIQFTSDTKEIIYDNKIIKNIEQNWANYFSENTKIVKKIWEFFQIYLQRS